MRQMLAKDIKKHGVALPGLQLKDLTDRVEQLLDMSDVGQALTMIADDIEQTASQDYGELFKIMTDMGDMVLCVTYIHTVEAEDLGKQGGYIRTPQDFHTLYLLVSKERVITKVRLFAVPWMTAQVWLHNPDQDYASYVRQQPPLPVLAGDGRRPGWVKQRLVIS